MITVAEASSVGMQLISVQKLFSLVFPLDRTGGNLVPSSRTDHIANAKSSDTTASQSSEIIDLSSCIHDSQVTIPTLNG